VSHLIIAASGLSAAPIAAMIGAGVVIGIFGHLAGSRKIVAGGIAVLFVATTLLLVGAYMSYSGGDEDPRPGCSDPVGC
jgi:hypothetical protein